VVLANQVVPVGQWWSTIVGKFRGNHKDATERWYWNRKDTAERWYWNYKDTAEKWHWNHKGTVGTSRRLQKSTDGLGRGETLGVTRDASAGISFRSDGVASSVQEKDTAKDSTSLLTIIGTVTSQAALLTALLYYFGRIYTHGSFLSISGSIQAYLVTVLPTM